MVYVATKISIGWVCNNTSITTCINVINYITRDTTLTYRAVGGITIFDPSVFIKNHRYREVF